MTVTTVTSLAQFMEIANSDNVAVFDFCATWCHSCKIINPVFEKLSAQFPSVEFYKVDVDARGDIVNEVGVEGVPTFIAFEKGVKLQQVLGASSSELGTLIRTVSTC